MFRRSQNRSTAAAASSADSARAASTSTERRTAPRARPAGASPASSREAAAAKAAGGRRGAHGEAQVETALREMIDRHRALGEPRGMVGGRVEGIGHGGTDATAACLERQRGEQRPAVVRPAPEAVAVGHARVAERVGSGPVAPQRRDVGAPRLHADRDHAARIVDAGGGCQRARVRPMPARLVAVAAVIVAVATAAVAQTPVETAHTLVARYHEDPAAIDRARGLLEVALAKDRQVETMIMLSYVYFLWGDTRAKTDDEK